MASRASLSVVVPTLNERARLAALLESLRTEGAPEEVLVVDGGSRDGTPELALEQGARVLRAACGRGIQLARGAAQATGDLFLFLHADTRVAGGALPVLRAAFEDPRLAAAGLRQRIDHPRRIYRWIERAANARVKRGWVYGDSGLCVRRADYEAVGGFRELPLFEDLDLTRRLRVGREIRLLEQSELIVSARRWEREGPVRATARNWALTLAWLAGVAPARLVGYYRVEPPSAPGGYEREADRDPQGLSGLPPEA